MKNLKNYSLVLLLMAAVTGVEAQVLSNQNVVNGIIGENAFFDASTNFLDNTSTGKGLVFPQADLTTWEFNTASLDGIVFPTAFDGMIVYNTATGTTMAGQGEQVDVEPGFYYFSNPDGIFTLSITDGVWKKMGSASLTEGSVTGAHILDGTITGADIAPDVIMPSHITAGGASQVLRTNAAGTAVEWATLPPALSSDLNNGHIYIGNGSNIATPVLVGGDATINPSTGALTIANAAVTPAKLAPGTTANQVLRTNAAATGVEWVNTAALPEAISVKTGAYTATANDRTIVYNLSAPATLTLPAASTVPGKVYIIRKIDSTENVLTFTQSINFGGGVTATSMNMPATLMVQSDGTNWYSLN